MRKISIDLSERETAHLARLSRLEGRTQAEIIRDAIHAYRGAPAAGGFAIDGVGEGPGGSVADLADSELMRGFGV